MTTTEDGGNMTIFNIFRQINTVIPYAVLFSLAMIIIVLVFEVTKKYKNRQKKQIKNNFRYSSHGIIFGKKGIGKVLYSPTDKEGHCIVIGGSGLGKTSAILIPTLRSWTGTSFTIDISGDIEKNVDIPHKLVYEPANTNSMPYSIFGAIDVLQGEDEQNEALEQLAFLIMPDDDRMNDTSKFFNTEGRKILTASLIAFYHSGLDFIQICEKIVFNDWKTLFNAIDSTGYNKAIQYINSFVGTSEQNTSGCKQATDSVLKLFATNEKVKKTIRRPRSSEIAFTPSQLEKYNIFVKIDDSKLKLYAPLLHIITAQSLEYFSERSNDSKTTILFCLDEFASLGKLELTDALRKLRKKHIRIMPLTQSLADIDLIYGRDERMAMMNNFRFKVILGADDTDTQEYFSKLIGYQTVTKHSTSSNDRQITHTESDSKEFIIEPSELAHLGDKLILLHPDGYELLKKNFYYK